MNQTTRFYSRYRQSGELNLEGEFGNLNRELVKYHAFASIEELEAPPRSHLSTAYADGGYRLTVYWDETLFRSDEILKAVESFIDYRTEEAEDS